MKSTLGILRCQLEIACPETLGIIKDITRDNNVK